MLRVILLRVIPQIAGLLVLLLVATLVTLKLKHQSADGPSVLFPGGELVSGALHEGAEPEWSFVNDISTIELQTNEPMSSRRLSVWESGGKVYVASCCMRTFFGRLWKDWAFQVEEGSNLAVARINGVRYERELIRVTDPSVIAGVARSMGGEARVSPMQQSVADGDVWFFEMAPRSS